MMHAEKRSLNISRETERLKEELIQLKEDSEANHEKSNEPQMEEDDTSAAMDFERSAETFMVVDDNEKTPIIAATPVPRIRTRRDFSYLSSSGKKKRLAKVRRTVSENLPPNYRITKSPELEPSIEESLNLLISGNLSENYYFGDDLEEISKNGIIIDEETVEIEFLAVGYLKFIPALMGLQGGSSDCFCPWCNITRDQVKENGFRGEKRTQENLILNAEQCENEIKNAKKYKIPDIRRKYGSVKGKPLLKFLKPENYVPPPFHLLAHLVDSCIKYVSNVLKNTRIQEIIKELKLNIHFPSQTLNGNESRKLLEKIRKAEVVFDGPGKELFLLAADVEQWAVARPLQESEINQLEICIERLFEEIRGFDDFPIANKLHALECHVVDFVRQFKSWGLYGEQSTESIHHICNLLESRIKGNDENATKKKQKFVTTQIIARNYVQK